MLQGLLLDHQLGGHRKYLRKVLWKSLGLWPFLSELHLVIATLSEVGLANDAIDRAVWEHCQTQGWVLLTDNRNQDGADSLDAVVGSLWSPGQLPVLTIASKPRFETDRAYALAVGKSIADHLFGIRDGEFCDQPRIWVPTE